MDTRHIQFHWIFTPMIVNIVNGHFYRRYRQTTTLLCRSRHIYAYFNYIWHIWHSDDRAPWHILIIKPTRFTNFSNFIFGIKLYMFPTAPLSIIRSFSLHTQQWYMTYRFADSLRAGTERNQFRPVPPRIMYDIPLLYVQWKTPDDGKRNCPKHAEFYSRNKFAKFVHLVCFVIRIYHDARSAERQIPYNFNKTLPATQRHTRED
jgi:hypothetical protein